MPDDTTAAAPLRAPFPWFGGKSRAAPFIWERLGNIGNFVEPFAGSLAVLLQRPHAPGIETVNDKDGFLCNVWRALAADPVAVARHCDRPPMECDLHAIHSALVQQREAFTARLMGDPDYYDAQVAGRWLYGIACWIGSGWCSGNGPWQSVEGQLLHLGNAGQGVHRKLLHLGDAGRGVHRQRGGDLEAYFQILQARLRYVRVCCGNWQRVMGPSVTEKLGLTGIVLDPPYSQEEDRDAHVYAVDDLTIAHEVRAWCLAHGENPLLRIVLCGYGTAHDALLAAGWTKMLWKANGGMGNQGHGRGRRNAARETLWCSPHCLDPQQRSLF